MNFKRWFTLACLALVVVAEVSLFRAYRANDELSANLRSAQSELRRATAELTELKNSDAGLQAAEIARLRRQNQVLTNQVAEWRTAAATLDAENQSNALHLATARAALRLQSEHLEQVQDASRQILDTSAEIIARKTCLGNLRLIDDAKQQWAADFNKPADTIPAEKDLLPYFKDGTLPLCPDGGIYSLNRVDEVPTCSVHGHASPQ
jgi:septal ring factor EnvC (AmiA/AmiB activator)